MGVCTEMGKTVQAVGAQMKEPCGGSGLSIFKKQRRGLFIWVEQRQRVVQSGDEAWQVCRTCKVIKGKYASRLPGTVPFVTTV